MSLQPYSEVSPGTGICQSCNKNPTVLVCRSLGIKILANALRVKS